MEFIDVALRKPVAVDADETQALQRYADKLSSNLRAVQEMQNSAGWALFVETLRQERRELLSKIEAASDPISLAKLNGTFLAVEAFIGWREAQAQALVDELRALASDVA